MGHVPHLLLPPPWAGETIHLGDDQRRHLAKVLRRDPDSPVTYTDGRGRVGSGTFGEGSIVRGDESEVARHAPSVSVAVAPPAAQDRARFVVEKLAELGVDELQWITSQYTQGRPPSERKVQAWAAAALQQSRGAWLMEVRGPRPVADLVGDGVEWRIADPAVSEGPPVPPTTGSLGVVVGPEGGWSDEERALFSHGLRLGSTILRTETAAVVGAIRCLQLAGRL